MTTTYILLAAFLSLASLFALNLTTTTAGIGCWYALAPFSKKWSAKRRANVIFALRFFPLLGALVFVLAFSLPAFLLYESYETEEVITYKLAIPAFISAFGMALAIYRAGGSFWKTRRLVAGWLKDAELMRVDGVPVPVYRIRHPFPLITVVGVFAPKMFVASQVFDSLDEQEFRAAVRHECGHLTASDNLKRILLGICRDLLIVPFARRLDNLWAKTAESAADEYAVQTGSAATALELASALVKISRIAPSAAQPRMLASASMLTEQVGDVTWRVQRLLRLSEIKLFRGNFSRLGFRLQIFLFCLSMTALFIVNHQFLEELHLMMENVVHILQ